MRLIKVKENSKDVDSYTYDANGITPNYSYSLNNKITSISNKKGNIILSKYSYTYCLDNSAKAIIENVTHSGRTARQDARWAYGYSTTGCKNNG